MAVMFRTGLASGLGKTDNLLLIPAHARFDGRDESGFRLRVGEQVISAQHVVLDTGTRSVIPPIDGLDKAGCIHAGNWLDLAELPERLVIVGVAISAWRWRSSTGASAAAWWCWKAAHR